jgi:ribonuclease P protein component
MLKILPVKKSAEFQRIGKKGDKFYSKSLILLTCPTPQSYLPKNSPDKKLDQFCRFGYTVAKTVSKLATQRNLAKRRLREAVKVLGASIARKHFDYVIIARKEILEADLVKISSDLKFCLSRIHTARKQFSKPNERPKKI